jgi:hypothetical protein
VMASVAMGAPPADSGANAAAEQSAAGEALTEKSGTAAEAGASAAADRDAGAAKPSAAQKPSTAAEAGASAAAHGGAEAVEPSAAQKPRTAAASESDTAAAAESTTVAGTDGVAEAAEPSAAEQSRTAEAAEPSAAEKSGTAAESRTAEAAESGASADSQAGAVAGLLAAGAVLPLGTVGAGDRAVPLTARAYRHPALDGRVVVRLVAEELGVAEDAAAGFLGLEPAGEPAVVGLGPRQSLGFPEWVLVHYPQDGHHALAIVPELERAARVAKSKPKQALDVYQEIANRLAASVPHFLPTFYEQAGRVFVGVENATYAAQVFGKARAAEAQHGLAIDEDRLDAVFLEFALAGALPVKVLAGYGRDLAVRLPAADALERFARLCVRRTAGGLPPSAQMATELRKLAKAAGADPAAVEQEYLASLLALAPTLRAPAGWWKTHRAALVALARRSPSVRRMLLDVMPTSGDEEMPSVWLDLLLESGAADALYAPDDTAGIDGLRPSDGTVGWLRRFQRMRESAGGWRSTPGGLPALYPLVDRCAAQLRAQSPAKPLSVPADVDLLDQFLALGIRVADPAEQATMNLEPWAKGEGQRDLVALAADPRFRASFLRGADRFSDDADGRRAISALISAPGGRAMLADWVRTVAARCAAAGLPELPRALHRLSWLPGPALALAEAEVRAAVTTDLAPVLARTLRTGIFDELGWPAWEQAAADLVKPDRVSELVIAGAWPQLVVAGAAQARVIDAGGTVLTHDLRVPRGDSHDENGYYYVDGELLVTWRSRADNYATRGYWHHNADRVETMATDGPYAQYSTRMSWHFGISSSLPLPGGGRTTGAATLHRGDTALPAGRTVISDGTSYWVWAEESGERATWYEYDPATGRTGRKSLPGFFSDTVNAAPAGTQFRSGSLLPLAPPAESAGGTPAARPTGGVLGWCVVKLPDGRLRGVDTSGVSVTVPDTHDPVHALMMPGAQRPVAVVDGYHEVTLVDADGQATAHARTDRAPGAFAEGTAILPPISYWHCLTPRDPAGSAALRALDDATGAALLAAGTAQRSADLTRDQLAESVRTLLPQVSDAALAAGIRGIVRFAAEQRATLDQAATRLEEALSGAPSTTAIPPGPEDDVLSAPLRDLGAARLFWGSGRSGVTDGIYRQVRVIADAVQRLQNRPAANAETHATAEAALRLHLDGEDLAHPNTDWWRAMVAGSPAVAYRAASAASSAEQRDALREFLGWYDAAGLAAKSEQSPWRKVTVRLADAYLNTPTGQRRTGSWHGLLPVPGGGLLAVVGSAWDSGAQLFTALYYDPAREFAVPPPYELRRVSSVGTWRPTGWLAAFLRAWDERGPAPWLPAAADEFAQLTGVTVTEARLLVAGLPGMDTHERNFLTAEARALLGLKSADANVARDRLRSIDAVERRIVVSALLPTDPVQLWTEGPNIKAAAHLWNQRIGKRTAVPEALLGEAVRSVRTRWSPGESLPALVDPANSAQLSRDLAWQISGDRVAAVGGDKLGFNDETLVGAVAMAAWLAYRLPAGDTVRAALPAALDAVRARLAAPKLMLSTGRYTGMADFKKAAGAPSEIGEGYERYSAVIMSTHDGQPMPALRVDLLDADGDDPYLRTLRGDANQPFPIETALRLVRDPRFAAALADPGSPAAGGPDPDGTWSPQDPARSVPELVAEAAKEHGLGEDAAAVYLMLLALPDPTDRNAARWTGWKPARLKAAQAELADTALVVDAVRARAGRTLFLPGGWAEPRSPELPLEQWKLPLYDGLITATGSALGAAVPAEPVAALYRRAWARVREGDGPRFEQLQAARLRRRRS